MAPGCNVNAVNTRRFRIGLNVGTDGLMTFPFHGETPLIIGNWLGLLEPISSASIPNHHRRVALTGWHHLEQVDEGGADHALAFHRRLNP